MARTLLAKAGETEKAARHPGACLVYLYLDDQGKSVRTRKLKSVPKSKRHKVMKYQDCSADFATPGSFSYVGAHLAENADENLEPAAERIMVSEAVDGGKPRIRWVKRQKKSEGAAGLWAWLKKKHRRLEGWRGFFAVLAAAVALAGLAGLVLAAFQVHPLWGLGVLLLPVVPVVFIVRNWYASRGALLAWLSGWVGFILLTYVF